MEQRAFLSVWMLALALAMGGLPVFAQSDEDCLACHSDSSLTMERGGRVVALAVDPSFLEQSAHGSFSCIDCHTDLNAEEVPHAERIRPVSCLACHGDPGALHPFHPWMSGDLENDSEGCKECHGTHEVTSPKLPGSKFHGIRLTQSCGECHREVAEHFVRSEHGKALAAGVEWAPDCLKCHEQPLTRERWNGNGLDSKIAQEQICLSCHLDNPDVRARMAPQAGFIAAYERSVHGAALLAGNGKAANCVDCHGSHDMKYGIDPESPVSKAHIPETCARCHPAIAADFSKSIHAEARAKGIADAPVCTDCHGEHDILVHTDPRSRVAAGNVSAQVCSPCHSSLRLAKKYGIASDRFQTFSDSYHGLAIRGGAVEVANCASCHGAHDIRRSSDPESMINPQNLAHTCGKCHPGANDRFAVGPVHFLAAEAKEPIIYWVAQLYIGLIVVVVGGMIVHNLLDFIKKSRRHVRIRSGDLVEEELGGLTYLRFTSSEQLQHAALLLSFTVLVVTGFMLRYPDAWWVEQIRRLSDRAFELRSLTHRVAAVVMVLASFYHLYYLVLTRRGREILRDIFPRREDFFDVFRMVFYNMGLTTRRPQFGRFSYIEKAEYWAVIWGTMVMVVTGFILWFEDTFIGLLTKLGWDVARTIHFYEAWLATLAILVWHFYSVIFNPDVYPMNTAWLTGKLSEKEMVEEHPLELEKIRRRAAEAELKNQNEKVVDGSRDGSGGRRVS